MSSQPQTLVDALQRASADPTTGLRLLDRRERATWLPWPELWQRAKRAAGSLQALGVLPEDRIALVYPTGAEFFEAFFGVLAAGATPVPLYPPVRLGRLEEYHRQTAAMLHAVEARLVLADRNVRRILGQAVEAARPDLGCRDLTTLPQGDYRAVRLTPESLGLVQFSSGTTVDPKPVALSHRAILTQAILLNGFWPDTDELRHSGVSWLPLYHDMGLIGCVFPALERPGVLTLIPPEAFVANPSIWLRAISRYGASVSPAPNFAYALCVDRIQDEQLQGVDLSSWRVALNGAEPVVPAVLREFEKRFRRWGFHSIAMTPVYGLSEAALAVTFSDITKPPSTRRFNREALSSRGVVKEAEAGVELTSLGRPLPGFELRIEDAQGTPASPGQVGGIRVAGPTLMERYIGQPELTAAALHNGWLDTGDQGFLWGGELFVTGRQKDLLILRGRNYAPDEVERAVDAVSGVRKGCAVAVSWLPEDAAGEVLLLLVEAKHGTQPKEYAELQDRCAEAVVAKTRLMPDRVVVLFPGTLPRTSSGKLRRREALRRYRSNTLRPPKSVGRLRIAAELARSAMAFARSQR